MRFHASVSATVWTLGAVFWAVGTTHATPLTVYNLCDESIDLYDNSVTETIAAGGSTTRTLAEGFSGMFRSGVDAQATLAEFAITGGYTWYDISIIPTGPLGGPGSCSSLEDCKTVTGGVGFNLPMQIAPSGCTAVTCLADGCEDAYQFPSDDGKTHACSEASSIDLTFCPGGSGSTTTTVTTTTTTTPATEAPATETPTVEVTSAPTTQATIAPTAAPSAASSSSDSQISSDSQDASSSSTALRGSAASEADSVTLTPETKLTPVTSSPSATPIGSSSSSSAGSAEVVSTQSKDSGTSVSTYLVSTLGALAIAAAIVVVLVVRHKKKQLEAMEPKESDYSNGGLLTP